MHVQHSTEVGNPETAVKTRKRLFMMVVVIVSHLKKIPPASSNDFIGEQCDPLLDGKIDLAMHGIYVYVFTI